MEQSFFLVIEKIGGKYAHVHPQDVGLFFFNTFDCLIVRLNLEQLSNNRCTLNKTNAKPYFLAFRN